MRGHLGRIEIEMHNARENTRFLPLIILVASRHERELSRCVAQLRSWQPLDDRVPIVSHALVAYGQKMERRAKAKLDLFTARGLHHLGGHGVPPPRAAPHHIGG